MVKIVDGHLFHTDLIIFPKFIFDILKIPYILSCFTIIFAVQTVEHIVALP